jgi:hypothetical protein
VSDDAEERQRAIAEEARRARLLRTIVDLTCSVLIQGRLSRSEAVALVAATRRRALELFPDKEQTYELVLAPRFARLMREFVAPAAGAKVIPFRQPQRD